LLPVLALVSTALLACGGPSDSERRPRRSPQAAVLEGRLAGSIAQGVRTADITASRRPLVATTATGPRRSGEGAADASSAGLRALAAGRHDKAVANLRSAVLRSDDWRDWNDLAVALIARAGSQDHPLDLLRALTAARRASTLAPDAPEARFNVALALSKLHLRRSAARAWEGFLDSPPLAPIPEADRTVAEGHLERLTAPSRRERWARELAGLETVELPGGEGRIAELTREFPDLIRIHAERQLVGRWSRAVLDGDAAGAARTETLGRAIGAALARQRGEHSVEDIFAFLATCGGRADRGVACARPAAAYAEGVEAFYAGDLGLAEQRLATAAAGLRELASPLRRWAEYFLVYATFHRSIPVSLAALRGQLTPPVERRYPSLAGRLNWRVGVAEASLGHNQVAREHYLRGQDLLTVGAGPEEAAFADALLAEAFDLIGDAERAWRHRLHLLRVVAYSGDSRMVQSMLGTASLELLSRGEVDAAGVFIAELFDQATDIGQPEYLAEAYRQRGELLARVGKTRAAADSLARSRSLALALGASARRDQLLETIELTEGATRVRTDPGHAVAVLTEAFSGFERAENAFYRRMALGLRARALQDLGDLRAALDDRRAELDLLEDQRAAVRDDSRLVALAPAQEAYDSAVEILILLDRPHEALTIAERGRCRYLLDLLGDAAGASAAPLSASEIQSRLPRGTALVEYTVLNRELVAWVVDAAGLRLVRVPVAAERVGHLVATLTADVEASIPEPELRASSAAPYRVLVAPLGLDLSEIDRLVFIPDRDLFRVPFAALFDEREGRYLIEDVAVAVAPSASLFLAHVESGRADDGPELVVGAPELTGTPYPGLPPLPGALTEARAVASLYAGASLLEGNGATVDAFLAALDGARLLHFAGHALANGDRALRSELLLARSGDHAGPLSFADLLERDVLGTPIVVLSACRTADGFAVDREGPLGLASVFIATGSRAVLATLWRVDDRDGAALLTEFHAGLIAGERPSTAWRRAVMRALGDPAPSDLSFRAWAAFNLFEAARES
jgi:CHAT domain-containing protein